MLYIVVYCLFVYLVASIILLLDYIVFEERIAGFCNLTKIGRLKKTLVFVSAPIWSLGFVITATGIMFMTPFMFLVDPPGQANNSNDPGGETVLDDGNVNFKHRTRLLKSGNMATIARCPRCNSSYGWNDQRCIHCGFKLTNG